MNDIHDVIEAFADGEPVDPPRLTGALSTADGREYLIDLLALRALVGDPDAKPMPGVGFVNAKTDAGHRFSGHRGATALFSVRGGLATAALVTVGVLAGFVAGQRLRGAPAPGPAVNAATTVQQAVPVSIMAPAPTRVIHLQNGVDWNERGGGN